MQQGCSAHSSNKALSTALLLVALAALCCLPGVVSLRLLQTDSRVNSNGQARSTTVEEHIHVKFEHLYRKRRADPGSSGSARHDQRLFYRSSTMPAAALDDTGSSGELIQCVLDGRLPLPDGTGTEDVLMHMQIRPMIHNGVLYVRGFLRAQQAVRTVCPYTKECLPANFAPASEDLFYKYAMNDTTPYKGTIGLRSTSSWTKHYVLTRKHFWPVDSLTGTFQLDPEDARYGEFELYADGFTRHCKVFAERPTRPKQIELLKPPAEVKFSKESKLVRPVHFISSPLMWHSPTKILDIIEPAMNHYVLMGVTRFVQYFLESTAQFTHLPRVQELVRAGFLQVIVWDSLTTTTYDRNAPHDHGPSVDQYGHQGVMYNHALLRYWLEDVYLLYADVDEYLMTPKPGLTIPKALTTCLSHFAKDNSLPVAGHQIPRRTAYCIGCQQDAGDIKSWHNDALTHGQSPSLMYAMEKEVDRKPKSVIFPTWYLAYRIHHGFPMEGVTESNSSVAEWCIVFMHMHNLHRVRSSGQSWEQVTSKLDLRPSASNWWWPYAPLQPIWNRGLPSNGRGGSI